MRKWLERAPQWTMVAALLAVVVTYFAGVRGGFDFTDEGFHYLSFAHPEYVSDNQTSFHLFGAKLFQLMGRNIVALRVATLLAVLIGTLVFLWGWGRFAASFAPHLFFREVKNLVAGVCLIASFNGFAAAPATFAYNFQNAACLLAASARPASEKIFSAPLLGSLAGFGLLVALDFFIKFSTSVPLALSGGTLFFLTSPQPCRRKFTLAAFLLVCALVIAVIYFAFLQNFHAWYIGVFGTFDGLLHGNTGSAFGLRYVGEIEVFALKTATTFAPLWAVAFVLAMVARRLSSARRQQQVTFVSFLLAAAGLVVMALRLRSWNSVGHLALPFFPGAIVLFALLALGLPSNHPVHDREDNASPWRVWLAAGFLFLLPYFGSFGTTNNLNGNTAYQLAPWILLASLPLARLDRASLGPWASRIGLLLLAAVATGQFYEGYWNQPYRVGGTRGEQTELTPIGTPASNLLLRPVAHDFIVTSRQALESHGFKPGDDLLVLFDLPGFVFAMGGISPGHPWYFAGDQNSLDLDLMRLNFITPERRQRAFIVRSGHFEESEPLLRKVGLDFPAAYELITPPMKAPFTGVPFEIWVPKGR